MVYTLVWIGINILMCSFGVRLESAGFWIAQAVFIVGRFLID